VIGLGNTLMADEGVGVKVVKELKKQALPPNVEVYEAGTPGLFLISLIEGFDKVILVDAVELKGPPGTIYRLSFEEGLFETSSPTSMHEIDAITALKIAKHTGKLPREVVIVGIEPKVVELGEGLSPEVEAAIPKAVKLLLNELKT